MNCPYCGHPLTPQEAAAALGSVSSPAKTKAVRLNGAKGGRIAAERGTSGRPVSPKRAEAIKLHRAGVGRQDIATRLGVSYDSVCRWTKGASR